MNYREITAPAAEPVTVAAAKQACRIDYDDDDDLIAGYITAARQYIEKQTRRAIYERQVCLTLDYFPLGDCDGIGANQQSYIAAYLRGLAISVPRPALVSVQSIQYQSTNGQLVTFPASQYTVDTVSEPGRIVPAIGCTWPYQNEYMPSQIVVNYTAGSYGDGVSVNTCPQTIKLAIMLLVGHWYANREAASADPLKSIPLGVAELISGETVETVYA